MSDPTSTPPRTPKAGKLRLNAEQWQMLQRLASSERPVAAAGRITGRLASNGLVATDASGCVYLTIFGLQRLREGP